MFPSASPSAPAPTPPPAAGASAQSNSPLGVEFVPLTALLAPQEPPKLQNAPANVAPVAPPVADEAPAAAPAPTFSAPRTVWGGVLEESLLVATAPASRKAGASSGLATRTYYRRKEEKEELEREVQGLEAQLQHFARRQRAKRQRQEMATRETQNQAMRFAIRTQRVAFANTMSFISSFLQGPDHSKYEPTICLGTDPEERHEKLLLLKPQRLEEALGFLTERQRFMSRTSPFCDTQRFVAENGDHCMVRFDVAPIRSARTVKQAFDAVLKFTYNLEIALSTQMGDITLRENEDVSWNSTVAQHRLVTTISDTLQVDTNNVTFAEYQPDSGNIWSGGAGWGGGLAGKEVGVAACNYVAEDGLYPYNPARLRQDITFFVLVTSFPRPPGDVPPPNASGEPPSENIVVVSRWTCFRIRKPEFFVSDEEMERTRESLEHVGDAMLADVRNACTANAPPS